MFTQPYDLPLLGRGYRWGMAWVVISSGTRGRTTVYASEQEAERVAQELAATVDEDTWVAISDQESNRTRLIKVGDDD
jgi:hypothetical protein